MECWVWGIDMNMNTDSAGHSQAGSYETSLTRSFQVGTWSFLAETTFLEQKFISLGKMDL